MPAGFQVRVECEDNATSMVHYHQHSEHSLSALNYFEQLEMRGSRNFMDLLGTKPTQKKILNTFVPFSPSKPTWGWFPGVFSRFFPCVIFL